MKHNVQRAPNRPPWSYLEAALQQNYDLDKAFNELCRKLARLKMNGLEQELDAIFTEKMTAAHAQQAQEGEQATFYVANF